MVRVAKEIWGYTLDDLQETIAEREPLTNGKVAPAKGKLYLARRKIFMVKEGVVCFNLWKVIESGTSYCVEGCANVIGQLRDFPIGELVIQRGKLRVGNYQLWRLPAIENDGSIHIPCPYELLLEWGSISGGTDCYDAIWEL